MSSNLLGTVFERSTFLAASAEEPATYHWRSAFGRALLRLGAGDLASAESDPAIAAAQFPEFVGLVYGQTRVDLLRGRVAEAAAGLKPYLGARPTDANALFVAARTANLLGNREPRCQGSHAAAGLRRPAGRGGPACIERR